LTFKQKIKKWTLKRTKLPSKVCLQSQMKLNAD